MLRVPETPREGLPSQQDLPHDSDAVCLLITVNVQRWACPGSRPGEEEDAAGEGSLRGPPARGLDLDNELVQGPSSVRMSLGVMA